MRSLERKRHACGCRRKLRHGKVRPAFAFPRRLPSQPNGTHAAQKRPAEQDLRGLRPPFRVAAQVEGELGRGALLLRPLPLAAGRREDERENRKHPVGASSPLNGPRVTCSARFPSGRCRTLEPHTSTATASVLGTISAAFLHVGSDYGGTQGQPPLLQMKTCFLSSAFVSAHFVVCPAMPWLLENSHALCENGRKCQGIGRAL